MPQYYCPAEKCGEELDLRLKSDEFINYCPACGHKLRQEALHGRGKKPATEENGRSKHVGHPNVLTVTPLPYHPNLSLLEKAFQIGLDPEAANRSVKFEKVVKIVNS